MKRGLTISIGCNLKKYRSIQRLAPFTSIPIIGTNAKKIKDTMKKGVISFISNFVSIADITIIINIATKVKTKCLLKKK